MLGRQSHPAPALASRLDHLLAAANLAQAGTDNDTAIRRFAFDFGAVHFEGNVIPQGDGAVVSLVGDLGPLPYSAENAPVRRRWLDALNRSRGPDRYRLGADGHLRLESRTQVAGVPNRHQLIETLTVVLLTLGTGIEPPLRH